MKSMILTLALVISGFAHASGAVSYTCAGYEPSAASTSQASKGSVSFTMIGANDGVTLHVVSKTSGQVAAKDADLDASVKGCQFSMDPDAKLPAYRVSISGNCGATVPQNIVGVCFFD